MREEKYIIGKALGILYGCDKKGTYIRHIKSNGEFFKKKIYYDSNRKFDVMELSRKQLRLKNSTTEREDTLFEIMSVDCKKEMEEKLNKAMAYGNCHKECTILNCPKLKEWLKKHEFQM